MNLSELTEEGLLDAALKVVARLREERFTALFAGGAVRDLLLGHPISDIDIATSARPDQVEELFDFTIPVGKQFGVVIVQEEEFQFEVATFRSDAEYADGRHPAHVTFSSPEEDARRRDFTVNALFLDPLSGEVIDFVGGQSDLRKKVIRTVGDPDARFQEDKLRLLRAVRFACRLSFEIEETTYLQLSKRAAEIQQVSQERIRDEILKILRGQAPGRGLRILLETGLLGVILPEVAAMSEVPQPPQFHPEGDVFVHTCLMFELSEGDLSETLALAILLHDVGKPPTFRVAERIRFDGHAEVGAEMAGRICRRLRFSRSTTERVVSLVKDHLKFMHVQEMRESTLKRFIRQEGFEEHLELHRLDCLGSHGDLTNYYFCKEKIEEFSREVIRPEPLIDGYDLIELGFAPGPIFSDILAAVEDRQLEGEITERSEALRWVRQNWHPE